MRRHLRFVVMSALLVASPVRAGTQLRDFAITANSGEAAIILVSEPLPSADYELILQRDGGRNLLTGGPSVNVSAGNPAPYVGRKLKAGTYVLTMVVQQRHWGTCFSNTVAFTLEPGKVYFAGTFNAREVLTDLQKSALERGKGQLPRGSNAIGWNPRVKPQFQPATAAELAQVQTWTARTMPRSTGPVVGLQTVPRQLGHSGASMAMQVCG